MPKERTVASTAQNIIWVGSFVSAPNWAATSSVVMAAAVKSPVRHFQK